MTKSKMSDLNDHLFAQMERLSSGGLTPEQIEVEAKRAEAMVSVADRITDSAKTQLQAARLFGEFGMQIMPMLPQIGKADE